MNVTLQFSLADRLPGRLDTTGWETEPGSGIRFRPDRRNALIADAERRAGLADKSRTSSLALSRTLAAGEAAPPPPQQRGKSADEKYAGWITDARLEIANGNPVTAATLAARRQEALDAGADPRLVAGLGLDEPASAITADAERRLIDSVR